MLTVISYIFTHLLDLLLDLRSCLEMCYTAIPHRPTPLKVGLVGVFWVFSGVLPVLSGRDPNSNNSGAILTEDPITATCRYRGCYTGLLHCYTVLLQYLASTLISD